MKTPIDYSISPDFSTMQTPKLFGATDPFHVFTATQPVNFYRSFITLGTDQEARKGYLPNVMLDQINNPNNYQLQSNIPKDDYESFLKLQMLGNGAANGGFVTSDTTGPAYKRSILMGGGDPYVKLREDWKPEANLSPNIKAYDLQTQSERNAKDQIFNRFTAELNFDGTSKKIETSNDKIIKREALDALGQRMLDWGTAKRLSEDFEAEGGALTWVLSKAAGGFENLQEQVSRIGTDDTYKSMSDLMQEAYGNQQDIAQYEVPGLFLSGGQMDDVANYVKYRTPDEIQNGFDPTKWWDNNINPEVISHLANLGVTKDDINGAIGSNEALSIIQFKLAETTISQRLQRYTDDHPVSTTAIPATIANLTTMMINDPDIGLSLGLSTVVSTIKRPLKLAQLTLLTTAQRTKNTVPLLSKSIEGIKTLASNRYVSGYSQRALNVGEGVLAIGQGDLPQYFKNYNWLAKVGIAGGIGAVANVGQNLTEQRDRIAFASAAMWNSEQDQYHISEFGFAALMGAGFGSILELNNAAAVRADEFKTLFKQKKILDAYKTTSLVGVIPQHGASIAQGLDAANTVVTAARAEQPVDVLTQTGEQVKDNRVTVTDASGKVHQVTEDNLVSIADLSTEDSLNGSHRKVTNSRTNEQVYVSEKDLLTATPETTPIVRSEEPPLTEGEKHLTETAHVTDTASVVSGANKADGLARTAEDGYMSRADGESDLDYAQRSINGGVINTFEDLARLVPQPKSTGNKLARLVEYKRAFAAMRQLLADVKTNKPPEWTANLLNQINLAELSGIDTQIANIVQGGTKKFKQLTPAQKKLVFEFIKEHSGKSSEEIEALLFTDNALSAYEKNLLRNRLSTPVDSKIIKAEAQKKLDIRPTKDSLEFKNFTQSIDYLQLFIGEDNTMTAGERSKSLQAFRDEEWFVKNGNKTIVDLYQSIAEAFKKHISTPVRDPGIAKKNIGEQNKNLNQFNSILRASLINLSLTDLKVSGKKLEFLIKNEEDRDANGSANYDSATKTLSININPNLLEKALRGGSLIALNQVVLHELGHIVAFLATPLQMLRIVQSYNELRNPVLLKFMNELHGAIYEKTDYYTNYGVVNPSEYFANYFAYAQSGYGLSALLNEDRGSIVGRSLISYISDIVSGIVKSVTSLKEKNEFTLVQQQNRDLNRIIKDIGNNRAGVWNLDMTNIITTDEQLTDVLIEYLNSMPRDQALSLKESKQKYFDHMKNQLLSVIDSRIQEFENSAPELQIVSAGRAFLKKSGELKSIIQAFKEMKIRVESDLILKDLHTINFQDLFRLTFHGEGISRSVLSQADIEDPYNSVLKDWDLFKKVGNVYVNFINNINNIKKGVHYLDSVMTAKSGPRDAMIMLFDPTSVISVLSTGDIVDTFLGLENIIGFDAQARFGGGLSSGEIQNILDRAATLSTSIAYTMNIGTLMNPIISSRMVGGGKLLPDIDSYDIQSFLQTEGTYINPTPSIVWTVNNFFTDETNYNNLQKYYDFINSRFDDGGSIKDTIDAEPYTYKQLKLIAIEDPTDRVLVQNEFEVPLASVKNTKTLIKMNRPIISIDNRNETMLYHMSSFNGMTDGNFLAVGSLSGVVQHIMNNTEGFNRIELPEGTYYHGSKVVIQQLIDFEQTDWMRMIYGGGLYTTNEIPKAISYADMIKGSVHKIIELMPVKFFGMEKRDLFTNKLRSDILNIILNENIQQDGGEFRVSKFDKSISDVYGLKFKNNILTVKIPGENKARVEDLIVELNDATSMLDIYNVLRDFRFQHKNVTSYPESNFHEIQDHNLISIDKKIRELLKQEGYGGFTHTGGVLTNTSSHTVKIYWEPKTQIKVEPIGLSDMVTPKAYITAHKLKLSKDKDGYTILQLPTNDTTLGLSKNQEGVRNGPKASDSTGRFNSTVYSIVDALSKILSPDIIRNYTNLNEVEIDDVRVLEAKGINVIGIDGWDYLARVTNTTRENIFKAAETLMSTVSAYARDKKGVLKLLDSHKLPQHLKQNFMSGSEDLNADYFLQKILEKGSLGRGKVLDDTPSELTQKAILNFFKDIGIDIISFDNIIGIAPPLVTNPNLKYNGDPRYQYSDGAGTSTRFKIRRKDTSANEVFIGDEEWGTKPPDKDLGYVVDPSHIIVNPDIVSVEAIGTVENGEFVWRSKHTNEVLKTVNRNEYTTEYRNINDTAGILRIVPQPLKSISESSIKLEENNKQVNPTSITEVTDTTKPLLQEEINSLLSKLWNDKSFMKKLKNSVKSVSKSKINTDDLATNALSRGIEISLKQIKKNEVPSILTKKTYNEIIALLTGISRNDGLKEYQKETGGGVIISGGSAPAGETSLLDAGVAHATMDGTTVNDAYRPNEDIEAGVGIDKLHERRDQFVSWLDSNNKYNPINKALIIAVQNLRLEKARGIQQLLSSEDPKQRDLGSDKKRVRSKTNLQALPENAGIRLYLLLKPEQADVISKLQLSETPEDKAKLALINKSTNTTAVRLEKKAIKEFNELTSKPQTNEKEIHTAVVDEVSKNKKPIVTVLREKQKNIAKDKQLGEETNTSVNAEEVKPTIPAAILKGIGDDDSFISGSWDGTPGLFSLGMLFTNENRASGATKASKYKFTVRSTLDKSKVFRVVRKGKTILHDINNVSEPLLNIAGLDKQRLNKITSVIEATHSPQEAIRLVLKALDLEGYTAIEFVDLTGNLIGHMPTSDKHVKVTEILNHEDMKSDGDPVGYLTPEQIAAKVTEPKVISEVLPETKVNPTEPVIDPIVLPTEVVDGNPVDTGVPIVKGESDIAVITPEEKFAHEVMNAKTALRYNGMTPKIIKIALLKFAQAAKKLRANIGETMTGIPEEFKKLLYTIHQAGEMIAEKNRQQLGDNYDTINNEFWLIYDREVAKDVLNKAVPEEKIPFKTIDDIIKYAHEKVNENIKLRNQRDGTNIPEFLRPLMPNDFIIVSSKVTNTNPDKVLFANDSLAHQMNMIAEKNIKTANKAKPNTVEKVELMSEDAVADAVIAAINESPHDNTMLLREGNWVGLIFGGSQRESRNWWRRSTTNVAALIDHGSGYGSTVKNLSNIVRTISAFASIDKVHLHHLTASKRNAFKTWEASSSEVYRMTSGIRQSSILLAKKTNEKLYVLLTKEIMVSMLSKKAFNKTNVETIIKSLIPDASQKFMDVATKHSVDLYNGVIGINKRMLGLENQTGWLSLLDSSGKPLNPAEYFPVTFVGEKVTQANYSEVVGALVEVRKQTLNEQKTLDTLVMLSLGWLYNKSGNILHKGREVVGRAQHQIDDANFDKQTLINLEERRYEAGTDVTKLIEMNGQASKRHFTYIDPLTGDVVVCRIPALKTDLSMLDLAKYTQVVNGSTSYLNSMWEQSSFKGLNPVNVMMIDLLDAKLYRGEYHPINGPRGKNPSFPMTMLNDSSGYEFASATPSLTNEEVLRSPVLIDILRADPLEAYRNFTRNRGFELIVQHEIDRMIGIKGVRMHRFMEILLKEAKRHATNLRGEDGAKEVQDGFNRLSEEYLKYQGRLGAVVVSSYGQFKNELTTVGLNVVRSVSGLMWGVMSATEPLIQLAVSPFTVGPTQSAKNLFETVRFLIGDKRFSMTQLYKDDIKESIFFMDMIRQDLHDGILTTPIDGVPRMTTWFDRIKASRDDRTGRFPYLSAITEVIANTALEVGSSKITTILGKKFSMQRYAKTFATYINSGAALKLANALAKNPKLETLRAEAMTSPRAAAAQKKLFITLARESGFGGRWEMAMAMNQYGLIQVDRIAALQAAFKKLGPQYSKRGLINFTELRELFHTNLNKSVLAGVDGQVGSDSFEALMNACELMTTTKGMISNPRGLNSETSLQSRTPMGRMMKSLLGWSRSFYNNVIGNYGGQRESAYLGSLIMYAAITAVTDMLKEWINGRDVSDMVKEMRDNPSVILFRILHNLPIAGQFTNSLQGTLEKINEISGGAKAKQRGSSWFPAIDMAEQYTKDLPKAAANLIQESFPNGDVPNIAKDIGTIGFNNYFNNSPLAIPPRLLQEMGIINETSAFGKYMNLIKKRKNSYSAIPDMGLIPEESKASRERKQQLLKELDTILRK